MYEESTEALQENEIQVEEVPEDAPADSVLSDAGTGVDVLVTDTEITESSTELLLEESTESLLEESTESLLEESTESFLEESTQTVAVMDDTATVQALEQIHIDLLIIIFLLLFFWLYERFRNGIRSFKKWTN